MQTMSGIVHIADNGNAQSRARKSRRVPERVKSGAPFTTTRTPPLAPRRFLQGGAAARARAISQSVSRGARRARPPRRALTGASSSILSCWQHRALIDSRHQNWSPEVIRGSLSSLTERTGHVSDQKWGLGLDFSNGDFSQTKGCRFWHRSGTLRDLRVRYPHFQQFGQFHSSFAWGPV